MFICMFKSCTKMTNIITSLLKQVSVYLQLGIKFSIWCYDICILFLAEFCHNSLLRRPISFLHLWYCRHFSTWRHVSVISAPVISLVPVKNVTDKSNYTNRLLNLYYAIFYTELLKSFDINPLYFHSLVNCRTINWNNKILPICSL